MTLGKKTDDNQDPDDDLDIVDGDSNQNDDLENADGKSDKDGDDSSLVIDLDDPDDQTPSENTDSQNPKSLPQKKHDRHFGQARVIKKLTKQVDELNRRLNSPVNNRQTVPSTASATPDSNNPRNWTKQQWDDLGKRDWQEAVRLKSKIEVEDSLARHTQASSDGTVLAESKSKALAKHPELNDDYSEKSKIFRQILDENPRYLNDPKGPIHAMRDMEDRMRELGYPEKDIFDAENRGVQKERDRQSRVMLNTSRGRTPSTPTRQVTLSKDEVEFCKHNNIDVRVYAQNKFKMGKNKTREVQV